MITYDLNNTGKKYDEVIQAIKDCSSYWCTFWKSSYLIKSDHTANQIVDKIKPYLDDNDRLIAVEVKNNNYQGWLADDDWTYIKEKIFS